MVVEKTVLVNLMVELGFKHVADMSQEKLLSKLKLSLPKVDEETVESIEDEEAKELLEKLIELPSLLDKLQIEESDEEETDDEEEASDEDTDAEEETDDEEDEEESAKAKKAKKAKKGKAVKKPKIAKTAKGKKDKPKKARGTGVIANIVAALKEASKAKPLSKEVLLKRLVKAFPDRAEASMKNTINAQLGYHLHANKGLNVQHNDSGYYLGK